VLGGVCGKNKDAPIQLRRQLVFCCPFRHRWQAAHHRCGKAHITCHDVCPRRCSHTVLPWYGSATEPSSAANDTPRPCANLTSCGRTLAARSMARGLGTWCPKRKGGCQQREVRKRKQWHRENAAAKRGELEPKRAHMWHSARPGAGGKAKRAGLVQTGKPGP